MAGSIVLLAQRALVSLLLRLAVACTVAVAVKRDSPDADVTTAFRGHPRLIINPFETLSFV